MKRIIIYLLLMFSFSIFIGCGKSVPKCTDTNVTDTALKLLKEELINTEKCKNIVLNGGYCTMATKEDDIKRVIEMANNPKDPHYKGARDVVYRQWKEIEDRVNKTQLILNNIKELYTKEGETFCEGDLADKTNPYDTIKFRYSARYEDGNLYVAIYQSQ